MFELRPYRRNNEVAYNPFRMMDEFEKRFFDRGFGFPDGALAAFQTDIRDEGDHYVLEADLPGFAKEDIQLDLNGDTLTVRAERHSRHEDKDEEGKYLRCERSYGAYSRQFDMSAIATDGIKAKYDSGVLTLQLPKKEKLPNTTKRLEIE